MPGNDDHSVKEVVDRLRHLHVEYIESGGTSSMTIAPQQVNNQVIVLRAGAQRPDTESEFEQEEQVDDDVDDDFGE